MDNIKNLINTNRYTKTAEPKRDLNQNWEEAKEFAEYIGLIYKGKPSTVLILKLFKNYGKAKVLALRGWAKDKQYDPALGLQGHLINKLKGKYEL